MSEPLRVWTPTFGGVANVSGVAFPTGGGLFFRRLVEIPGLVEFFGRIDVTFSGSGIAIFSLSPPPGVGVPGAGNAWGHVQYNNGGGTAVFMQLGDNGAGLMQILGAGTVGTRVCGISGHLFTT